MNSQVLPVLDGEVVNSPFDYSSMDGAKADRTRAAADFIISRQKNVVAAMLQIGAKLLEVKEDLEHGQFLRWVQSEIRWSPRTAQRYMGAAEVFAGKSDTVSYLPVTTVYKIAAVDEPLREEVVKRIETERLPDGEINAMISDAKRERHMARVAAQEAERKTAQQIRRSKAYREKQRRLAEIERQEREATKLAEETAASKAALMIIKRFGDDLPKLLELTEKAGHELRDLKTWLTAPYGQEFVPGPSGYRVLVPKAAPQNPVDDEVPDFIKGTATKIGGETTS